MNAPKTELLKMQIEQHATGFNHGLFVTIDTQFAENPKNRNKVVPVINDKMLYEFTNKKLFELFKRTHRYCYGKSYVRKQNRLKVISAIEIGNDRQRLHAHCVMLHQDDTDRTTEQMSNFVTKNCEWIFKIAGTNAYKVEAFDRSRFWTEYFVKETTKMFYLHNGFLNIDFH